MSGQGRGPENSNWRGGEAGYAALHYRVRNARGKATGHQCVRCPRPARDWAQVHTEDGTDIWADYVPMCRSCHMAYDRDSRPWLYAPSLEQEAKRKAAAAAANRARRVQP